MAKKILSILCALAMLVTMVSVAAFTVSADEPTTGEIALNADTVNFTHVANAARLWHGVPDAAAGGLEGYAICASQLTYTAQIGETYNIGDAFNLDYSYMVIWPRSGSYTIQVGDLTILVELYKNNSVDYFNTVSATYGSETVIESTQIASSSAVKTLSYVPTASNPYLVDADTLTGDNLLTGGSYTARIGNVSISYDDGALAVTFSNGTESQTVNGTIANADFSDSQVLVSNSMSYGANNLFVIHNLSGSYDLPVVGGDEPDEPVVEDKEIVFDADNFTFTKTSGSQIGHGVPENGGAQKYLFAVYKAIGTATSNSTYNIGDSFEFSFQLFYHAYIDAFTIQLGDLAITFDVANPGANPANYVTATYGDQTVIARTGFANASTRLQVNGTSKDTDNLIADINATNSSIASGSNYTYRITDVTCSYADGVLTITAAKPNSTSSETLTGNISNADFSDSTMSFTIDNDSQYTFSAIHNFTGTYTPYVAPEVDPLAPTGVYPTLNSDLTLNVIYANAADIKDNVTVTATVGLVSKNYELTEKDGYLVASIDFLTPDQFGSTITLVAADSTGTVESNTTTYSVKQYCKNMMDNANSSTELKQLCMALLQFGGKVQALDGSDTITADMSTYITNYAPTAWTKGDAAWSYTGTANGATWAGSNLNFADEIGINVYFTADGEASDYTVVSSIGDVSDVIVDPENSSLFMATIRISSSMLSEQIEVTVKDTGNDVVSETFTLSVEDWVNYNIDKMDDDDKKACASALMTYGDAAATYGATLN